MKVSNLTVPVPTGLLSHSRETHPDVYRVYYIQSVRAELTDV